MLRTRLHNLSTLPQRMAAYWLRRRGWVVFYLDRQSRVCSKDTCWLALYVAEEKQRAKE
jgi:hypothetical protein